MSLHFVLLLPSLTAPRFANEDDITVLKGNQQTAFGLVLNIVFHPNALTCETQQEMSM